MEATLTYDATDGVVVMTMNRPNARNALNKELRQAIREAMVTADADDTVSVIVLTGADPAFCAGMDLKEVGREGLPVRHIDGPGRWWPDIRKPVIGAVNGVAITGGLELALACDILIGSENAAFGDTHAQVGVMPGGGLTPVLPRVIGLRRAKEMSFTGRFLKADEAYRCGLISHLAPHDQLLTAARAMAADIAAIDSATICELKRLYDDVANLSLRDGLNLETETAGRWLAEHNGGRGVEASRMAIMSRGREQIA